MTRALPFQRVAALAKRELKRRTTMITLLLVDDYQAMRTLVRHYITRTSDMCIVGEAEDGVAAVALAPALCPDVIVMDMQMPGMDGITATSILRETLPQSAVIMFSSDDIRTGANVLRQWGCGPLLTKAIPAMCCCRRFAQRRIPKNYRCDIDLL